ncbi:MAG TPA: DUF3710 domain-containing protein [Micromonosporaceae bacterium]
MIFSKGRRRAPRHAATDSTEPDPATDPLDDRGDDEIPEIGPYDADDAPEDVERLDLGSLKIPAVPGVEVRIQADENGAIQQVVLVHGDSALQIGAFAAPRSEGIWEEVRAEIADSLRKDGVRTTTAAGEYGTELLGRVPTPNGPMDVRFVGVDGPRWMVRAVYQGPAAADPAAAGPLREALRGLVVDRGKEAMPVREPLPLRLPREVAEQAQRQAAAEGGANGAVPGGSV